MCYKEYEDEVVIIEKNMIQCGVGPHEMIRPVKNEHTHVTIALLSTGHNYTGLLSMMQAFLMISRMCMYRISSVMLQVQSSAASQNPRSTYTSHSTY